MISDYLLPETAPEQDRPLPQNLDVERAVLGSLYTWPELYWNTELNEHWFALDSHRIVFRTIRAMLEAGKSVDFVTMTAALQEGNQIEGVGGVAYLASLSEGLPRRPSLDHYADILREKFQYRQIINVSRSALLASYDASGDPMGVISDFDAEMLRIGCNAQETASLESQSNAEWERVEKELSGEVAAFYPIGLPQLENQIGGLAVGEMTIIAGRPGQGKTSLLDQIVMYNCPNGVPCHVFALEMRAGQMLRRIWCAVSGVPFWKLRRAKEHLSVTDKRLILAAKSDVERWPLIIEDSARVTPDEILSKVRMSKRRKGTAIVGIDYLQKLRYTGRRDQRFQQVTDACVAMAAMAKEEQVALAVLSSITEKSGSHRNDPPTISDMRQSGDIQYEASTNRMMPPLRFWI